MPKGSKTLLLDTQPIHERIQLTNSLLWCQLNDKFTKTTANSLCRQTRSWVHLLAPDLLDVEARLFDEIVVAVLHVCGDLDLAASFLIGDHGGIVV
jgi:hypothetical protein